MKREANFGLQFRAWMRAQKGMESAAFELKQVRRGAFPFNDVQEHQINALLAASGGGILYKAPDDSRGVKPFDYFYLKRVPAYIFIQYPEGFVGLTVENFIVEKEISKRKSLTYARALHLASFIE